MYTNLDLFIIVACAIGFVASYIYLRATGAILGFVNWKLVAKRIRRLFK